MIAAQRGANQIDPYFEFLDGGFTLQSFVICPSLLLARPWTNQREHEQVHDPSTSPVLAKYYAGNKYYQVLRRRVCPFFGLIGVLLGNAM